MDYQKIMKELVNPTSHPARSGKELSHRKVFTAKAGELLPILCEEMVPNDYFEVDTATLIRSFPMQTAAFLRAKVNFDFFFVPTTAVWRNFNRFYYQRNDNQTSYMNGYAYEPNISLYDLATLVDSGTTSVKDSKDCRAKVLQLLGYGNFFGTAPSDYDPRGSGQFKDIGSKSLTVLPIAAYNRIYNMWYRNAWRDEPTQLDAETYSLDNWLCNSYATSLYAANIPTNSDFLKMHYHPYFSDLFMGSLPNQQFGSVSTVDVSLPSSVYFVSGTTGNNSVVVAGGSGSLLKALPNDSYEWSLNKSGSYSGNDFDVLSLRKALALQKWKEYNMRAGWKNKNQARAMFGVSTPDDRPHDIEHLASYSFPFMVDEVLDQSSTGLGDLAGKGIGVGNGEKVSFNCGERHGYLFCIAYVLPQAEYDANMIDKSLVRSEPFDHFVPAFENLGMEPVYKYELNSRGNTAVFNNVLGFAPRYHEYKTRVDKVYCDFVFGKSLSSWVSVRRDLAGIANSGTIPTDYFYVNPSCLDTIFAQNASKDISTDQFMLNVNFDVKAVRPMSDLGLPTL